MLFFALAALVGSASADNADGTSLRGRVKDPCICTMDYVPVCGSDGTTYGNECSAKCAGVDTYEKGECPEPPKDPSTPCSPCVFTNDETWGQQWNCMVIDCAPTGCDDEWCQKCPETAPFAYPDDGECCASCHEHEQKSAEEVDCYTKEVWGEEKQRWCCANKQIGCTEEEDNFVKNCYTLEVWSEEKERWCCANKQIGCTVEEEEEENCYTKEAWGEEKQRWCCANKQIGCSEEEGNGPANSKNTICEACLASGNTWQPEAGEYACTKDCGLMDISCYRPGDACPTPSEPCMCTMDLVPVCGSDGTTYSNECSAKCTGVDTYEKGECPEPCICTMDYAPVCGGDGTTYSNECSAKCAGVDTYEKGECPEPCEDKGHRKKGVEWCTKQAGKGKCKNKKKVQKLCQKTCGLCYEYEYHQGW